MSSAGRRATSETAEGKAKPKQRRSTFRSLLRLSRFGGRDAHQDVVGTGGSGPQPAPASVPAPSQAAKPPALTSTTGVAGEPRDQRRRSGLSSVGSSSFHSTEDAENRADEDASIRPISPHSTMASSFQTSSAASDVRTFRSAATGQSHSTKPTTLFSVPSDGGGVGADGAANRIALPSTPASRYAQDRRLSGLNSAAAIDRRDSTPPASIVFSSLPQSGGGGPGGPSSTSGIVSAATHYPRHTQPDLRRNPAPHSPALDNASMLTLASSTAPARVYAPTDENASVRALPPTPTRRPSDGSIGSSRWSAAVAATHRLGNDGASYRTGPYAASSLRRDSLTGTVPSEYRMRRDSSSSGDEAEDVVDAVEVEGEAPASVEQKSVPAADSAPPSVAPASA